MPPENDPSIAPSTTTAATSNAAPSPDPTTKAPEAPPAPTGAVVAATAPAPAAAPSAPTASAPAVNPPASKETPAKKTNEKFDVLSNFATFPKGAVITRGDVEKASKHTQIQFNVETAIARGSIKPHSESEDAQD